MSKFKVFATIFLLILCSTLFYACSGTTAVVFDFVEDEIAICEGDRVSLEEIVETENFDNIDFSVSDSKVIYILENKTIVALKEGVAKVFAKANDQTKTLDVKVHKERVSLKTPSDIYLDRKAGSLKWFAVAGATSYEIKLEHGSNTQTFVSASNSLNLSENNIEILPNVDYKFSVKALASEVSIAYINSSWSTIYVYNEIETVKNLSYDVLTNKIKFEYEVNTSSNQLVFDITISGATSKTFRIASNNTGVYEKEFLPKESGEYNISVVAKMSARDDSLPKDISVIKLEAPTIKASGNVATANTTVENAKITIFGATSLGNFSKSENGQSVVSDEIDLSVGELINVKAFVAKIKSSEELNGKSTYYLPSNESSVKIERLENPKNINIEKLSETKIALSWVGKENVVYQIFQNGIVLENEILTEKNGEELNCKVVVSNLIDAKNYVFEINAQKVGDENKQFLDSGKVAAKTVVKLAPVACDFDISTLRLEYQTDEMSLNGQIQIRIINTLKTSSKTKNISAKNDIFVLEESDFDGKGNYQIVVKAIKTDENFVYLNSEDVALNIYNPHEIGATYKVIKDSDEVEISFEKIDNQTNYIIKINDKVLTNVVSDSEPYITNFAEISENNTKIVRFYVKNVKNAGNYKISVQVVGEKFDNTNYALNSKISEFSFSKLDVTQISYELNDNSINISWLEVANVDKYKLVVTNIDKNEIIQSKFLKYTESRLDILESGNYKIEVFAISDDVNILNSNAASVCFKKLNSVINIVHETREENGQTLSRISFDKVEFATSYKLTILQNGTIKNTYTNFVNLENSIVFELGQTNLIFDLSGDYAVEITAMNNDEHMMQSNKSSYAIKKLDKAVDVSVDYLENQTKLNIHGQEAVDNYLISINGGQWTNSLDITSLGFGVYDISIVCVGNGQNILNSDVFSGQFVIKERLSAPLNVEIEIDTQDDNYLILSFDSCLRAVKYLIEITSNNSKSFVLPIDDENKNLSRLTFKILRTDFEEGNNQIRVFALPSDDDSVLVASEASQTVVVSKCSKISSVSIIEDKIDLTHKQAIINDEKFENIAKSWPELASGQTISIKVRNINPLAIDDVYNGVFYLASEWIDVSLTKLTTPKVSIIDKNLSYIYPQELSDYKIVLSIKFLGITNKISSSSTKMFDITNINDFDLEQFILDNLNLQAYEGDYKIYVSAVPLSQEDTHLYQASENSSLSNNSSDEDFKISKQLINDIEVIIENDGEISLIQNKSKSYEIDKIDILIEQNSKQYAAILDLTTLNLSVTKNELNDAILTVEKIVKDKICFKFNIFNLLDGGSYTISYKVLGDEIYFVSAQDYLLTNSTKLNAPEFEYNFSILGNIIELKQSSFINLENVDFVAIYNSEQKLFVKEENRIYFVIPYEWENANQIKIQARTTSEGVLNSNLKDVFFDRLDCISNLHLTEDSDSGKTYLEFDKPTQAREFLIYLSQDNFVSYKVYQTDLTKFEITDEMLSAGDVKIRVVCLGYDNHMNSDIVVLQATKLSTDINLSTPNGIFSWSILSNLAEVKEFRITTKNEIINIASSLNSYNFENLDGEIELLFKIVGKPELNIISSDNIQYFVYKFQSPNSLAIKNGEVSISETYVDYVKIGVLDYKIYYENGDFNYFEYKNYDEKVIEDFYNKLTASGGNFSAKTLAVGNSYYEKNGNKYYFLNSDVSTSIQYKIYEINIDADEFYLTQKTTSNGNYETYFNYEWADLLYKDEASIRVILRPKFSSSVLSIANFTTISENGRALAYYIDVAFNNKMNSGEYLSSYVSILLPAELPAGNYDIEIQKTSTNSASNLSSKYVKVLYFKKLAQVDTTIDGDKLQWNQENITTNYSILFGYLGNYKWIKNISQSYFVPGKEFEDLSSNARYSFVITAVGNVPESKPSNTKALEVDYVVASNAFGSEFVKLKQTGDLKLVEGSFVWIDDSYLYFSETGKKPLIEFCFEDLNGNEKIRFEVNANEISIDTLDMLNFIDKYLSSAQKNIINNLGEVLIKYRQMGKTFNGYINSEYKYLEMSGAQTVSINGTTRCKFKMLNAAKNIKINDATGVSFTGSTYNSAYISIINYDVVFGIENNEAPNGIEYKIVKRLQNSAMLSFEELKSLLRNYDPEANIKQIFVVARGNDTYYLTSLKSPILNVCAIVGEAVLTINQHGQLEWNDIEKANKYELRVRTSEDEKLFTITKQINGDNVEFYINGEKTNNITLNEKGNWQFDISSYDDIKCGNNDFYIRYIPKNNSNDVFAIPGEWTNDAIKVFKIQSPTIELVKGDLNWSKVDNASSYIFNILYRDQILYSAEYTNIFNYNLGVYELFNLFKENNPDNLMTLENFIGEIPKFEFKIQATGGGNVNGVFYLTSQISTIVGITVKDNVVENVKINENIISWEDSEDGDSYIIMITDSPTNPKLKQEYETNSREFDLSSAGLSAEFETYYVYIKIKGDSKQLSSLENEPMQFKVLKPIGEIQVENGMIVFDEVGGITRYQVRVTLLNYYYYYTITKSGDKYNIVKIEKVSRSTLTREVVANDGASEINYTNGKIYFWPSAQTSSTLYVAVCAYAYSETSGDTTTYYISSPFMSYSTYIEKISIGTVNITEFSSSKISLYFKNLDFNKGYIANVEIINENGGVISATLKVARGMTIKFDDLLEQGTYTIKIRVTLPSTYISLKSDILTYEKQI